MADLPQKKTQPGKQIEAQCLALRLLSERCPRLTRLCYWAGSAALAIEELHHRLSFDLDFHTQDALRDVRPILAEIRHAFPGLFEVVQSPDEFGSGFSGILALPGGERIADDLAAYDDVLPADASKCRDMLLHWIPEAQLPDGRAAALQFLLRCE